MFGRDQSNISSENAPAANYGQRQEGTTAGKAVKQHPLCKHAVLDVAKETATEHLL